MRLSHYQTNVKDTHPSHSQENTVIGHACVLHFLAKNNDENLAGIILMDTDR